MTPTLQQYNVLILGSGGREHAIAWKLKQSPRLNQLFIAPGNAGTAGLGTNLQLSETDFPALKKAVLEHQVNLLVVGPEAPLVMGVVDFFAADPLLSALTIIGPAASGARLEGSKAFAKEFMVKHGIPTAAYRSFSLIQVQEAISFLKSIAPPYVIKADGLAAGKGVVICDTIEEASAEVIQMLENNKFGTAGQTIVIEQFLRGIELSVFVLTNGKEYILLPEAKDYKKIGENDQGPNTGGMGSLSPVPFASAAFMKKVEKTIIQPTLQGLRQEGIPYNGFIFFGLMKVDEEAYVIEYNVRLGDPETEVILPRIQDDLLEVLLSLSNCQHALPPLSFDPRAAACVMLVAPGYPASYPKGMNILGLEAIKDCIPFHAGTRYRHQSKQVITSGGRIIALTALEADLETAFKKAYKACEIIDYQGKYYRRDLGKDVLNLPAHGK